MSLCAIGFGGCVSSSNIAPSNIYFTKSSNYIDVSKEEKTIQSKQNAIHSLSGMLNIPKLGFTYFNTEDRNPLYLVGYSSDKSFYITQTMQNKDIDEKVLKDLRDELIGLRELSYTLIKEKLNKIEISPNDKKLILDNFDTTSFDKKYNEISKKLEHHGVFVAYWDGTSKEEKNDEGSILSFQALAKKSNNTNDSGFMILSGLKFSTLYVSDDVIDEWKKIATNIKEVSKTYPRIVTTTIQAKDIYYFTQESLEMELNELIDIKVSKLANALPSLSRDDITKLLLSSISYEYTKLTNKLKNINSMGITSKMQKEVYPLFYTDAKLENIKEFINGKNAWDKDDSSLWQTIYSVDTDIFEIKKWLDTKPNTEKN